MKKKIKKENYDKFKKNELKKSIKKNLITTFSLLLFCVIFGFVLYSNNVKDNIKYPWYIEKMKLNNVWKKTKGDGVVIAILDSGINKNLEKRVEKQIVSPYNFLEKNTNINDKNGHGTALASILLHNDKETNFFAISPNIKIMPLVVIDESGRIDAKNVSDAIIYAVDHDAQIINMSFGFKITSELIKNAINYAYEKNVFLIAAVGDYEEEKVLFPASNDKVIGVQAQSIYGTRYKKASWGNELNIKIPGENILCLNGDDLIEKNSGSSYSTIIFSGILALKLSYDDNFSVDEIISIISFYNINDRNFFDSYKFIKHKIKK